MAHNGKFGPKNFFRFKRSWPLQKLLLKKLERRKRNPPQQQLKNSSKWINLDQLVVTQYLELHGALCGRVTIRYFAVSLRFPLSIFHHFILYLNFIAFPQYCFRYFSIILQLVHLYGSAHPNFITAQMLIC